MVILVPTVIQPLFNKFTPLAPGDLRNRVEALATKLKFPLKHLYEIDGSKRSSHSNAYFFGLPWVILLLRTSYLDNYTAYNRANILSFMTPSFRKPKRKKLKQSSVSLLKSRAFMYSPGRSSPRTGPLVLSPSVQTSPHNAGSYIYYHWPLPRIPSLPSPPPLIRLSEGRGSPPAHCHRVSPFPSMFLTILSIRYRSNLSSQLDDLDSSRICYKHRHECDHSPL